MQTLTNSQQRLKAVSLFEAGYLEREIAGFLGKSRGLVAKWKARWRKDGGVSDGKRSGRPNYRVKENDRQN